MSDSKPDLMQNVSQYRERLTAELAKVDEFLAMADRMADPEKSGPGPMLFTGTEAPDSLH